MQGGAQYGYTLLFIILISSLSAAVTKYDCEIRNSNWYGFSTNDTSFLNKPVAIMFWIIAELAIIATDIAEVIAALSH